MHRLSNADDEAKTADCSVCGPGSRIYVNFSSTQGTWQRQCVTSALASRKGQRAGEEKTDHRLTDVDLDVMFATCSRCGPKAKIQMNRLGTVCSYSRLMAQHRTRARRVGYATLIATVVELEDALIAQGGLCGSCNAEKPLVPDHCHETGRFRGWLCRECNLALGLLGDSAEGLKKALTYLEAAKKGSRQ